MPLSKAGQKVMGNMAKEYGANKGEQVFYATMNKRDLKDRWEKKKDAYKRKFERGDNAY